MPYPEPPGGLLDAMCPIEWSHPLNRGLVGHWAVTPLSGWRGGPTLRDLVRGGRKPNDGTLTNGPAWQGPGGRPGGCGALSFDGVNDHVSAAAAAASLSSGFTLSLWARSTVAAGLTDANRYLAVLGTTGEIAGVTWTHTSAGYSGACYMKGNGSYPVLTWTRKPPAGAWVHVCMTWDGATIRAYLDGVQQGAGTANSTFSSGTDLLVWGAGNVGGAGTQPWPGLLDDERLCSRALSAAEVRALHDESRRGYPLAWRWVRARAWSVPPAAGGTAYAWWAQQQGGAVLGSGVL